MDALRDALNRVVAFVPALVAGLVVVLFGWIVATVARRVVLATLPRTGFDRFLARHRLLERAPETRPGSRAVGSAAFWVLMLIAFMQAARIWGLTYVAGGLAQVIAYLPNVLAAVLIFGAAMLVGNWVRDRLGASPAARESYGTLLPGAVRAAILTIGAFMALRQLLIAPEFLVIAFTLVLGAIAVATALAFGLGGRHAAERMTSDWYARQRARRASAGRPPGEPLDLEEPQGPGGIH